MPISKNPASKRNYQKEDRYEDTPEQIKHREERNAARHSVEKASGKKLPPGVDVAHIKPLANKGTNSGSNTRVESIAKNRSWRKGQKGYSVPIDK